MRKLKLIWDFRGPYALKTAEHHEIHLKDYIVIQKLDITITGVEKLTDWKLKIGNIPLVAIGGMTVERATGAFLAGANVVSAVTDITLNDNPETRVRKWLDTCK